MNLEIRVATLTHVDVFTVTKYFPVTQFARLMRQRHHGEPVWIHVRRVA